MQYSSQVLSGLNAKGYESISIHECSTADGTKYYRVDLMRTDGHIFKCELPTLQLVRAQLMSLFGDDDTTKHLVVEKL